MFPCLTNVANLDFQQTNAKFFIFFLHLFFGKFLLYLASLTLFNFFLLFVEEIKEQYSMCSINIDGTSYKIKFQKFSIKNLNSNAFQMLNISIGFNSSLYNKMSSSRLAPISL